MRLFKVKQPRTEPYRTEFQSYFNFLAISIKINMSVLNTCRNFPH